MLSRDLLRQEDFRFTAEDDQTWRMLFSRLDDIRPRVAHPLFVEGLAKLGMTNEKIPSLKEVNSRLKALTGWQAVPVEGLESGESFYPALARREFPVGNFIRDRQDLGYTPAPDIFHDLYGHVPFFVDQNYAEFCQQYGELYLRHIAFPERRLQLERFFWFTIEFGLIDLKGLGRRIFGGGILSSLSECQHSLSAEVTVTPFTIAEICAQDYRIDIMQPKLFVLQSEDQLYQSLSDLERHVTRAR